MIVCQSILDCWRQQHVCLILDAVVAGAPRHLKCNWHKLRTSLVGERCANPGRPGPNIGGAAFLLGHQPRQWAQTYDLDARVREAQQAIEEMRAYRLQLMEPAAVSSEPTQLTPLDPGVVPAWKEEDAECILLSDDEEEEEEEEEWEVGSEMSD